MVQQEGNPPPSTSRVNTGMGQGVVCGASAPLTDSDPTSPQASMHANGGFSHSSFGHTAADVQASLTGLASEPNISQDDLIAKLRSVVDQNLELKESLAQNNLALRQQLGLVVRWSQLCQQEQQQQQHLLSQTALQLTAVKQENAVLKTRKDNGTGGRDEAYAALQQQLAAAQQQLMQLQHDKDKIAALARKFEADITLLKCDLTTSRGDQERLQLERDHLLATNTELKQQLRQHHLQQQQQQAAQAGTCSSAELQRERETSAAHQRDAATARAEADALASDLRRLQQRLDAANAAAAAAAAAFNMETKEGGGVTQDSTSQLQEEVVLLKEDVAVLEQTLRGERAKLAEERQVSARAAADLTTLRCDLQDARDTIHRNTNTDHYYQTKIRSINEQHDAVTAKLLSYEELLVAKNEELAKLKQESGQAKARLAEVNSEGETIAILRAQVEVYQGDFRAEREAREALASEREQLRDELRQLHTRNATLLDELAAAQRGGRPTSRAGSVEPQMSLTPPPSFSPGTRGSETHHELMDSLSHSLDAKEGDTLRKEEATQAVLDESLFYCPKCNKSFDELRPLEAHVNRCLDED